MKKEEILSLLKKISYPGFSRDIVSFGMIDDVIIEQDKIQITLKLKSQNEEKKNTVVSEIKSLLKKETSFKDINILFDQSSESAQGTAQAPTTQGPSTLAGIKHIVAVSSGKAV